MTVNNLPFLQSMIYVLEQDRCTLEKLDTIFSDWIMNMSEEDEEIFALFYSRKENSRPNDPTNVIISILILIGYTRFSKDILIQSSMYDYFPTSIIYFTLQAMNTFQSSMIPSVTSMKKYQIMN